MILIHGREVAWGDHLHVGRVSASDEFMDAADEGLDRAKESFEDIKEGAESATTRLRARARLARRDLKDLKATLADQATDLKEEARLKILAQLDRLEKALSKDPDETEDHWNEEDA